mmetsp:Transcript_3828/g.10551  ORF Transcript_3828/g.10551 Transcript_3828/m.10551 type:complete len:212 (-) Transcript_3828:118-753(-)
MVRHSSEHRTSFSFCTTSHASEPSTVLAGAHTKHSHAVASSPPPSLPPPPSPRSLSVSVCSPLAPVIPELVLVASLGSLLLPALPALGDAWLFNLLLLLLLLLPPSVSLAAPCGRSAFASRFEPSDGERDPQCAGSPTQKRCTKQVHVLHWISFEPSDGLALMPHAQRMAFTLATRAGAEGVASAGAEAVFGGLGSRLVYSRASAAVEMCD